MGLTMVVAVITELAIFYLTEIDADHPLNARSVIAAGNARLPPILMLALIAILTLLALALGIGRGSGLHSPLATAIIFGLGVAAPLVITLLPILVLVTTRGLNDGGSR